MVTLSFERVNYQGQRWLRKGPKVIFFQPCIIGKKSKSLMLLLQSFALLLLRKTIKRKDDMRSSSSFQFFRGWQRTSPVCRWAISVLRRRQTSSETARSKQNVADFSVALCLAYYTHLPILLFLSFLLLLHLLSIIFVERLIALC